MDNNTIAIFILLGVFFGLLLVKVPITFALGLSAVSTALYMQIPLMAIVQQMAKGISSFSLITIPFFILAGEIMGQGGISTRLVNFSKVIVGRIRGGLAMVDVLACLFFGGLSGSSVADTTSIGSIMIPMMEKEGYDKDFAVDVTIVSATQGVLVPPSHNMILYSLAAGGVSISSLFLAGILPGVFLGLSVMVFSYFIALKRKYPKSEQIPFKQKIVMLKDGILGLMTAVIIMGGIMSGICTATESAALATVYAFIITFFVYKDVPLSRMGDILRKSLKTVAMVMGLIAASAAFGWMIAMVQLPALVTNALISITDNRILIFLLINVILLFLGMYHGHGSINSYCYTYIITSSSKIWYGSNSVWSYLNVESWYRTTYTTSWFNIIRRLLYWKYIYRKGCKIINAILCFNGSCSNGFNFCSTNFIIPS